MPAIRKHQTLLCLHALHVLSVYNFDDCQVHTFYAHLNVLQGCVKVQVIERLHTSNTWDADQHQICMNTDSAPNDVSKQGFVVGQLQPGVKRGALHRNEVAFRHAGCQAVPKMQAASEA